MTLPTIPPFDYPDWGQPGTVTASFSNITAVAAPGDVLWENEVGYYNHTLLAFDGNADGESYSVYLKWYTANPTEGGTVVISQFLTIATGCIVVVPMTNPTTYLQIRDAEATAYPHNALLLVTQFAAYGNMVGYPGGETALYVTSGTSGPETLVWAPAGCAPGRHAVKIRSEAPTWDLYIRYWNSALNNFDILIADETTDLTLPIEFIGPASSWQLVYDTAEAGDRNVWVAVTRLPA